MPFGFFRKFTRGWTPRSDYDSRPTVRDIGKGSSKRSRNMPQSTDDEPKTYADLKAECLEGGMLWEDPDFPADETSIFYKDPPSVWPDIEWLRPSEICEGEDPQLFVDGATRMDVNQGILGDCWLLAAVSCLATREKLLHRIVPDDQSFSDDYAGIFRFHFWQYGRWVEVTIDDRLPCNNGKLIYMHSDDRNEFWSALLEKAYAKLVGCYECLSGGLTSEALTDFTGGIVERFELRDKAPEDLFKQMFRAATRKSLMGCSIDAAPHEMEAGLDNGLIIGHAYSVTDVRYVEVETPKVSGRIPMVRVRNPWGDSHEWKGSWSDDSEEWQLVPDEEKEEMGLTYEHDGEFWMSFKDWVENFQRVEICYLGPDTLDGADEDDDCDTAQSIRKWEGQLLEGAWKRRVTAGGCRNYPKTFWTNPQYRVTVTDPDEDDEDGNGSIIVAVMQKNRRKLRTEGKDNETIGYAIYQLDDPNRGTLDYRFFQSCVSAGRSPAFINTREISDHHTLPPGDYVIVPSTFEPDVEADFIVRIFSEKPDEINELDDATATAEQESEELGEDDDDDVAQCEEGLEAFRGLAGEDGEVDAYELKDILDGLFMTQFEIDGFSADMCRSMVAMRDLDMSGKLGFADFKNLWKDLTLCKKAFKMLDTDGNNFFSSYEFRRVLNTLGLRISNATFNAVVMRYSNKEGEVRFDDFVACYIKLKTTFETFKGNDTEGSGEASFGQDEFVQMCMYS